MKLTVIQNGRMREAGLLALRDEYCARFRRYGDLRVLERSPKGEAGLWPSGQTVRVLVDEGGDSMTSRALARWLDRLTMERGPVTFAIGAADGHDPATRAGAELVWSLGPLTLPHQVAHLVVVEQLYRAGTILAGSRYHRD